ALAGPAGAPVRLRLRDGNGRPVTVQVVRRPARGAIGSFGNLPERPVLLERERVRMPDGTTVGVIRFDLWMPVIARAFDEAVDELRDTDGIVVDVRGNLGGVGAMSMGFAGHFIDERLSLGTMRTRDTELRFVVNPRRVDARGQAVKPYAGPVAILTDALSASTSEIFAGGMQGLGRARVFGETTAGQALPAMMRRLPNGDVLVHAFASLTGPGGEPLEGRGVVPDQAAPPARAELLAGRDPALEAAKRWIAEQRRSGPEAR
ncbi:MAG TPA: S41 family peptidase, partial [Longimicrobiaceae bacterium]|nr:S41 family peptidase [Longimicrobiaceae bacterium]